MKQDLLPTEHASTEPTESAADGTGFVFRYFYLAVVLLGGVGFTGNSVVLWLLVSTKQLCKRLTTTLLINQSAVDLVSSVVLSVTYVYAMYPPTTYTSWLESLGCMLFDAKLFVFCTLNSSTFCLVLITLERYLMIVFPVRHRVWMERRKLVAMSTVAWIWGFFCNTIITVPFVWTEDRVCYLFIWPQKSLQNIVAVIYYICVFLAPACFFIYAYGHILWIISRRKHQIQPISNASQKKISSAQVNMTKTCVLVTLAFLLCWTPNQTYFMLFQIGYDLEYGGMFWLITQYLCFVNSCINPFIYAFKHAGIRAAIKTKFNRQVAPPVTTNTG
ncbi:hypothetical protein CAPTEDRAFT_199652 [Capitella teleta]|uniref:G-protein coupled receptors family 1 profile domain-containing protein n=1 Tax=Capitella teleta TaxID=283909 RepID=R7UFU9_CAPTE|nr:hypothetical protein CAPTEDRAFT_199652 [Capitella teleta]|eukprot:ELU02678.1 hypothetical protein CAPTEDRAFT_199652 [Capitella teleta]